ncbi:hypothetical protein [Marinobacterium litorale]|uniref:hypothetical protein n=1 Tax=Marinobacterium litorale TaxID=404770 RepID=UPI0003F6F0CF|nr:hypothetical protein [Marinobacterium litorale]
MQLTRCPVCHSRIHLDALVQDDAGRELLAMLARLDRSAAGALVSYMSLFRSKSRDLANDRALRIATEALELAQLNALTPAMAHTVEQMRVKQLAGSFKPLTNHNYLKRVLENQGAAVVEGDIEALPANASTGSKAERRAVVSRSTMNIHDIDW